MIRPLVVESLRHASLFRHLPAEPRGCFEILAQGDELRLSKGQSMNTLGFFVAVKGDVMLDGNRIIAPGDHFGELALLANILPPVAVARVDTRLFCLTPDLFAQMLDACPRVTRNLLSEMAARLVAVAPTSD